MNVEWAEVGDAAGLVAAGVSAVYGALKAFLEGRDFITDLREKRKPAYRDGYKVTFTIDKTVIKEDLTECIRMRTVRAYRTVSSLRMDHWPEIVLPDRKKATGPDIKLLRLSGPSESDSGRKMVSN